MKSRQPSRPGNSKTPNGPATLPLLQFAGNARWALSIVWTKHSALVLGMGLVTVVDGLVPAGLALIARGLINAAADLTNTQSATLVPILPWVLMGLALTVLESVTRLFNGYLTRRLSDDLELSVNSLTLEHAARLDVSFFEDPRFQDVLHHAQHNTAGHFSSFLTDTFRVMSQLLQIASLVAVLVAIEPFVIVALSPVALIHFVYQWRLSKRHYIEQKERSTKRRWSSYFVSLLTSRRSVPETRLLGLAPMLIRRFQTIMLEFSRENRKRYLSGLFGGTVDAVLTSIGVYVTMLRVLQRAVAGGLTIGDVAIFGTAGLRLRSAMGSSVSTVASVLGHVLYIANLREFLEIQPRMSLKSGRVSPSPRGEVEFRNVSFTYPGSDAPALIDVSFHIRPGETVALVGKNGAGKTTLAKLIARFYDPDSGSVLQDGIDLREMSLEHLYRQTAFVFQRVSAYEATASENIAYGDYEKLSDNRSRVEEIARTTRADQIIRHMPRGYDTALGRTFGEYDLSTGQWQQMAIARAFARTSATLLILDEPTASLDVTAEYDLFDRFRTLAKGKTTVLVSHRFSTVRMADRIIVLDQKRIVEQGTHDELLANGGHYASLYDFQLKSVEFGGAETNFEVGESEDPAAHTIDRIGAMR